MKLSIGIDAQEFEFRKEVFKKLKTGLSKKGIDHRFVEPSDFHIPLIQLGEIEDEGVMRLEDQITALLGGKHGFSLKLSGLWAYPEQSHARILWVGVQNSRELRSLRKELLNTIYPDSLEEGEFKPLFPLVRMKNYHNMTDVISPYKNHEFKKLNVRSLSLYSMISGGAYPRYARIRTYCLNAEASSGVLELS